jgi:hypothetical protein
MEINKDAEYALNISIKTTARKYFAECLKNNEVTETGVLASIITNITFKNYSKYFETISNNELKDLIRRKVRIEIIHLQNKIEKNLNSGCEIIL